VRPTIDGALTAPDEWQGAGVHRAARGGAMHRGLPELLLIRFGVGDGHLNLMLETSASARALLETSEVVVSFPAPLALRYRVQSSNGQTSIERSERLDAGWVASPTWARAAAGDVLEVAIPVAELGSGPGAKVSFRVLQSQAGVELQRHPETGPIEIGLEEVNRD
jgi:hypothetical protein